MLLTSSLYKINVRQEYCEVWRWTYSGRKITESLGNVTVRGEKGGKSKRGARWPTVCLSMYSITENIYYSQLSSVVILLQPEPVSHRIIQGKHCVLCEISSSHGGEYDVQSCLLGCTAV
jgi:hypothetical protein